MAKTVTKFGSSAGLNCELQWDHSNPKGLAADATRGSLQVWVGEFLAWGSRKGSEVVGLSWTWVELLEFLATSWANIEYEQGYPLGFQPASPALLRDEAEARWQSMSAVAIAGEQQEVFDWEESHDLSRGLQGLFIPSLFVVRFGNRYLVATRGTVIERPLQETLGALSAFGDFLAERLDNLEDQRSIDAVENWRNRNDLDAMSRLSITVGRSKLEIDSMSGGNIIDAFEFTNGVFSLTETVALVAMTRGILDPKTVRTLMDLVRAATSNKSQSLDVLSDDVRPFLETLVGRKPYDQGYDLAIWLRAHKNQIGFNTVRFDPDAMMQRLGVRLTDVDFGTDLLDGVACWGPQHGPAVWINKNSKHRTSSGARRVTIAHELCHLLVDRDGALPLAEIVNGNIPRPVEQRANAFAAELLLPRTHAVDRLFHAGDVDAVVKELSSTYDVSMELAARQITNGAKDLDRSIRMQLQRYLWHPNV